MLQTHSIPTEDGWHLQLLEAVPQGPTLGPPMLCIHGFSQSHLTFTSGGFAQHLAAQGIHTYVLDLRGHGGSGVTHQRPPYPVDMRYGWNITSFFQRDIPAAIRFIQKQHPEEKVVLCGHSMGGILSVVTALQNPAFIAALVVLAAPLDARHIGLHIRLAGRFLSGLHQRMPLLHKRWNAVPMHAFFRLLDSAYHKVRPGMSTLLPLLLRYDQRQVWPQIWHPDLTPTAVVREMFQDSHPEAMGVVKDLMRWAANGFIDLGEPQGVNYTAHFHRITQPVIGAWGERDILAPPRAGNHFFRTIRSTFQQKIVLPDTRHIDITAGKPSHTVREAILKLYQNQLV
ncbi:MAG: alpha/beta fold hydrolase [Deltaproteobacteria bacterium]|nr:MAG: alpha/beta fold hydrolase [Deltaproteobacteria bacterium]